MNEVIYYAIKALEDLRDSGHESIPISGENIEFLLSLINDGQREDYSSLNSIDRASEANAMADNAGSNPITPNTIQNIEPPVNGSINLPEGTKQEQWNWLRNKVLSCPVCNAQVNPGKKIVFGVGNLDADIFLCGEAPGADEEIVGEPFVGRAGQLLTKIITAMGIGREDVYIGNIMNWRPKMPTKTGNRPPTKEEMQFCLPYLCAQLQIVKPKVILALGATAVNGLLGQDDSRRISDIRGKWLEFNGIKLIPTFHPSYVLRNNSNQTKRLVWEDFMKVMEFLGLPISDKQRKFFT
ncbi:MAG: hypothetical protein LBB20_00295 [Puniceicoccales bacterium]|jgi:DNA polymerase|nr:hypothetical protein [Puniceicoccales bacterium]